MIIKLNRPLWGKKSGELIDVSENYVNWAVNKGYAEKVEKGTYSDKEDKPVLENKDTKNVPSKRKGRRPNN